MWHSPLEPQLYDKDTTHVDSQQSPPSQRQAAVLYGWVLSHSPSPLADTAAGGQPGITGNTDSHGVGSVTTSTMPKRSRDGKDASRRASARAMLPAIGGGDDAAPRAPLRVRARLGRRSPQRAMIDRAG